MFAFPLKCVRVPDDPPPLKCVRVPDDPPLQGFPKSGEAGDSRGEVAGD